MSKMPAFNEGYTKSDINYVERSVVEKELGFAELKRLAHLHHWLAHGPSGELFEVPHASFAELTDEQIAFRSAPSIIVRSEAELFGINMPRFAFRALLADNKMPLGFVNLRRIESFVKAVSRRLDVGQNQGFLRLLRSNCRCIGDSFLKTPDWIHMRGYHVITTRLERWYGEREIGSGTAFVTHFPIGGGMCAQATCFMASALLHAKAKGVFGVAEITMLASTNPHDQRFLKFSGLTPDDLARYFRHPSVGLNAMVQNAATEEEFRHALRSYVFSDCPVVLPVDMRYFKDRSRSGHRNPLYQRLGFAEQTASDQSELHAVLVVGARRSDADGDDFEFLIHDPATLPYAEVSAKELFEAAKIVPGQTVKFIPVTPSESAIPLRNVVVTQLRDLPYAPPERVVKAIRDRAARKGSMIHSIPGIASLKSKRSAVTRSWRLVKLSNVSCVRPIGMDQSKWAALVQVLSQLPSVDGKYAWIEFDLSTSSVTATLYPARNTDWIGGALLAPDGRDLDAFTFEWDSVVDEWRCQLNSDTVEKWMNSAWPQNSGHDIVGDEHDLCPANDCPVRAKRRVSGRSVTPSAEAKQHSLSLSLISSFTTRSREVAETSWRQLQNDPNQEQYLWFQQDIHKSLEMYVGDASLLDLTAVDAMAMIKPGGLLSAFLVEKHTGGIWNKTVALASFIPEISADPETKRAKVARQAIRFLGRLAIDMQLRLDSLARASSADLPPRLRIELVAGSLIDTVFHNFSGDDQRPELVGSLLSRQETHRHIAENLHRAFKESDTSNPDDEVEEFDICDKLAELGICFAIEQEPGPIFSLGSRESLVEFCAYLERHQANKAGNNRYLKWKGLVGLNVDIAHWAMSGIDIGTLPEIVRWRIAHSHISGHHEHAHFGDTWLDSDHEPRFKGTIEWLRQSKVPSEKERRRSMNYPQYSGSVSVEYEAARCLADVNRSLNAAKQLLAPSSTESC